MGIRESKQFNSKKEIYITNCPSHIIYHICGFLKSEDIFKLLSVDRKYVKLKTLEYVQKIHNNVFGKNCENDRQTIELIINKFKIVNGFKKKKPKFNRISLIHGSEAMLSNKYTTDLKFDDDKIIMPYTGGSKNGILLYPKNNKRHEYILDNTPIRIDYNNIYLGVRTNGNICVFQWNHDKPINIFSQSYVQPGIMFDKNNENVLLYDVHENDKMYLNERDLRTRVDNRFKIYDYQSSCQPRFCKQDDKVYITYGGIMAIYDHRKFEKPIYQKEYMYETESMNIISGNVVIQTNHGIDIFDNNLSIIDKIHASGQICSDDDFLIIYNTNYVYDDDMLSGYMVGKNKMSELMHMRNVKRKFGGFIQELYSGQKLFHYMRYYNGKVGFVEYHDTTDWYGKSSHIISLCMIDFGNL